MYLEKQLALGIAHLVPDYIKKNSNRSSCVLKLIGIFTLSIHTQYISVSALIHFETSKQRK